MSVAVPGNVLRWYRHKLKEILVHFGNRGSIPGSK